MLSSLSNILLACIKCKVNNIYNTPHLVLVALYHTRLGLVPELAYQIINTKVSYP